MVELLNVLTGIVEKHRPYRFMCGLCFFNRAVDMSFWMVILKLLIVGNEFCKMNINKLLINSV